jgi:hypothetical protein
LQFKREELTRLEAEDGCWRHHEDDAAWNGALAAEARRWYGLIAAAENGDGLGYTAKHGDAGLARPTAMNFGLGIDAAGGSD